MDDDRDHQSQSVFQSPHDPWANNQHVYPHSHHGTPVQEYSGFNYNSPPQPPMDPSAFTSGGQQRPSYPALVMPVWPSMLSHQPHQTHQQSYQQMVPQSAQPVQQIQQVQSQHISPIGTLPTPVSATSTKSNSHPGARKTLSDQDRRRMCLYAEENPLSKQTEIGAIFGVERSTVSKVLRQKEKYLVNEECNQPPIKRANKGRGPDIERALSVWAKNQEKKGLPLTDDILRQKARDFSATAAPEHQKELSQAWINKFKLNHNLMGARSRKSSLAPDETDYTSGPASLSQTPNGTSPISPHGVGSSSPHDLHNAKSQESLKNDSPDGNFEYQNGHGPFHSQSTTSLHSAFTDTAPSSFSPGPTSPFFTPDSGTAPSPFVAPLTVRPLHPGGSTSHPGDQRPRSQTFPLLNMYTNPNADLMNHKYASGMLDSPMEEAQDPLLSMNEAMHMGKSSSDRQQQQQQQQQQHATLHASETMRPPPLPAHVITPMNSTGSLHSTSTSIEDAHRAMEIVCDFFKQQTDGSLNPEELLFLGKLMEKVALQARIGG